MKRINYQKIIKFSWNSSTNGGSDSIMPILSRYSSNLVGTPQLVEAQTPSPQFFPDNRARQRARGHDRVPGQQVAIAAAELADRLVSVR